MLVYSILAAMLAFVLIGSAVVFYAGKRLDRQEGLIK
jgi:hypothetical protein